MPTFLKLNGDWINLDHIRLVQQDGDKLWVKWDLNEVGLPYPLKSEYGKQLLEMLHHCRFTHAGDPPGQGELLELCKEFLDGYRPFSENRESEDLIRRAIAVIARHEITKT